MYIQIKIYVYTIVVLVTMITFHINYFNTCIKYFINSDIDDLLNCCCFSLRCILYMLILAMKLHVLITIN